MLFLKWVPGNMHLKWTNFQRIYRVMHRSQMANHPLTPVLDRRIDHWSKYRQRPMVGNRRIISISTSNVPGGSLPTMTAIGYFCLSI